MPDRQKMFLEFLQNLHLELSSDQENKNGFADEHERLWFLGHRVESTMEYFEENLHKFCKLASAAPPGESLQTSLFTFFLISIRLNS